MTAPKNNRNAAKPARERASAWIQLRVTARRKKAYRTAAARAQSTLSTWSLEHLDRAAGL